MSRYAENTGVPVERSKTETTLRRYGATKFMTGRDQTRAVGPLQPVPSWCPLLVANLRGESVNDTFFQGFFGVEALGGSPV